MSAAAEVTTSRAARRYAASVRQGLRQLRVSYDWQRILARSGSDYLARDLPVTVVTITGAVDFPSIVPMLTGFLSRVGHPRTILVVDDGTLSEAQRECVLSISPLVSFYEPTTGVDDMASTELTAYAAGYPMGKKLAALVDLTRDGTTPILYVDTDVWFSSDCRPLVELLTGPVDVPWYMHDESSNSLDSRALPESRLHVNSGFLILPPRLDWRAALDESRPLIAEPEWFTEQTVVHRALHQHGAKPLPREQFLLRWDDVRSAGDAAHNEGVAVRHYVTPVRHKYWVMVYGGYARSIRAVVLHLLRRRDRASQAS